MDYTIFQWNCKLPLRQKTGFNLSYLESGGLRDTNKQKSLF